MIQRAENLKLCKLKRQDIAHSFTTIQKLVAQPRFICRACARSAHERSSLCKPAALSTSAQSADLSVSVTAKGSETLQVGKKALKQAKKALKQQKKQQKKLAKILKKQEKAEKRVRKLQEQTARSKQKPRAMHKAVPLHADVSVH